MDNCKNCKKHIELGSVLACPNCGLTFCIDCATKTKSICPNCFHNLEYIG